MKYTSILYASYDNKVFEQQSTETSTSSSSATFSSTSSGYTLIESINNSMNLLMQDNFNDPNITQNNLNITITSTVVPTFYTIIDNISSPPCIIFDNNNNLYITSTGTPNKLLKYNKNYVLENFVSDEAWINNDESTLPVAMAFNKDFTYMYIANFESNNITVIDMEDYTYKSLQLNTEDISDENTRGYRLNQPNGLAFDSTYSYMVATNITDANLVKIELQNSPYIASISPFIDKTIESPILITNNNSNNNFYVSDLVSSTVYKVNENHLSKFVGPDSIFQPRGVSFNTNYNNKLWITNSTNSSNTTTEYPIVSADIETCSIINILNDTLFNNPRGVIFDEQNYMYICNFGTENNIGSILKSTLPVE